MRNLICAALGAAAIAAAASGAAHATTFTSTSPTGGALPSGVTPIGGIVLDLTGANGNRVVSQVAASTEFVGSPDASAYPLLFGTQTGFGSSALSALGGGLRAASIRVTLYDGDTQAPDFDFNENRLLANGVDFGNFSDVATQETDGTGTTLISSGSGFGNDILDTGFFSSTDAATLSAFYATLSSGKVDFQLDDLSPGDQYYDFTQGLDASVVNVGSGPTVTPPTGGGNTGGGSTGGGTGTGTGGTAVPEPASAALLGAGLLGLMAARRRRRS